MARKRAGLKHLAFMAALLLGAGLACNAPLAEEGSPEPPAGSPTSDEPGSPTTSPGQATVGAPQTVPSSIETEEAQEEEDGVAPTFTPIQPPTLAATLTPSATATRRPAATRPPATNTPEGAGGPLTFTYHITWRLKDASAKLAIATVTFNVKGGSGDYTYFRDDLVVDGPMFEYEWATCSGNPGSLRVDSSDGQTTRKDYFETPPCPTLTPTP